MRVARWHYEPTRRSIPSGPELNKTQLNVLVGWAAKYCSYIVHQYLAVTTARTFRGKASGMGTMARCNGCVSLNDLL